MHYVSESHFDSEMLYRHHSLNTLNGFSFDFLNLSIVAKICNFCSNLAAEYAELYLWHYSIAVGLIFPYFCQ